MNVQKFEDLEVWCFAREVTRQVYRITQKEQFFKDTSLRNQTRRSSVSIMANIAEGFERNTNKEFIHFLFIAKGSAGELRSHINVALDNGYITSEEFKTLETDLVRISRSLSGLIKYLSNNIK